MSEKKITYIHPKIGSGRATVAIELPEDARDVERYVRCAVAYCSPKDHFSRAMGRTIATGRLEKNKDVVHLVVPAGQDVIERVHDWIKPWAKKYGPGWAKPKWPLHRAYLKGECSCDQDQERA